jgi:hypothetical protein
MDIPDDKKLVGDMTHDELLKEAARQQAERDKREAEIRRLDIGDLIESDTQVGDDFFGNTEEERDEWVRRGGNFGPSCGIGGSNNKKRANNRHYNGNKYDKRSNNGSDIELGNKQIESIVQLIAPYYKEGVRDFIISPLSEFLYRVFVPAIRGFDKRFYHIHDNGRASQMLTVEGLTKQAGTIADNISGKQRKRNHSVDKSNIFRCDNMSKPR